MKLHFSAAQVVFALAFTATAIGFSSFCQQPNDDKDSFRKDQPAKDDDSTSRKHSGTWSYWNPDQLNDQMRQLDLEIKMLELQMKSFDATNYQQQAADAMKQLNMAKISAQFDKAFKDSDWQKLSNTSAKDMALLQKMKMGEAQKQFERAKADMLKQKLAMKLDAGKINGQMKKAMLNAQHAMEHAKAEMKNLKDFTDELQKDKLIDKSKGYKIELRSGELYIDEKKQSKEISDKYRKYYRSQNFTIDMSGDDDTWI